MVSPTSGSGMVGLVRPVGMPGAPPVVPPVQAFQQLPVLLQQLLDDYILPLAIIPFPLPFPLPFLAFLPVLPPAPAAWIPSAS